MNAFRLFFIHRSSDAARVQELQASLRERLPNLPFEDASPEVPFADDWKAAAGPIIASCDALVCVVGPTACDSEPIDWELREAHRLDKPLIVARLSRECAVPAACRELHLPVSDWDTVQVAGRIGEVLVPKALFNPNAWPPDPQALWNQYNLMAQSWEALVGRRQTVNTLYLSADAALLAGIGGLISATAQTGLGTGATAIAVLAFLGAALSFNWRRTLISYGTLSRAKSKIVGTMEAYMPARLFDAEWRVLEARRYKSTTQTDTQTALFFLLLFAAVMVAAIAVAVSTAFA